MMNSKGNHRRNNNKIDCVLFASADGSRHFTERTSCSSLTHTLLALPLAWGEIYCRVRAPGSGSHHLVLSLHGKQGCWLCVRKTCVSLVVLRSLSNSSPMFWRRACGPRWWCVRCGTGPLPRCSPGGWPLHGLAQAAPALVQQQALGKQFSRPSKSINFESPPALWTQSHHFQVTHGKGSSSGGTGASCQRCHCTELLQLLTQQLSLGSNTEEEVAPWWWHIPMWLSQAQYQCVLWWVLWNLFFSPCLMNSSYSSN